MSDSKIEKDIKEEDLIPIGSVVKIPSNKDYVIIGVIVIGFLFFTLNFISQPNVSIKIDNSGEITDIVVKEKMTLYDSLTAPEESQTSLWKIHIMISDYESNISIKNESWFSLTGTIVATHNFKIDKNVPSDFTISVEFWEGDRRRDTNEVEVKEFIND